MQKFTCYPVLLFVFSICIVSCDISYFDQEIEEDIAWKGTAQLPVGYLDYTLSELFEELGSNNFDSTSSEALKFSYSESFSGDDDSAYNVKIADKTIC